MDNPVTAEKPAKGKPMTASDIAQMTDAEVLEALRSLLDKNMADFDATLEGLTKEEIAEIPEVAATRDIYCFLQYDYDLERRDAELLLRMDNPLQFNVDNWPCYNLTELAMNALGEGPAKEAEEKPLPQTTLKLYSPLTAELFFKGDNEYGDTDEAFATLDGWDLAEYKDTVLQAIEDEILPEERERGLMHYFDGSKEVDEKVHSLFISAEVIDHNLYGVAVCQVSGTLTPEQLNELKETCIGQYADGWGEGFEQRPRQTSEGELYIHFWQGNNSFFLRTAQEMGLEQAPEKKPVQTVAPKHKKTGKDRGNAR